MTHPFKAGFDPKFKDVPDYIIGVTKEIWEDRRIHSLRDYYSDDIHVRSPASMVIGNSGVIPATQSTLAEFPDRELLGEDVIWCDAPNDGFLSSHRLYCTATHTGAGMYGAPTGRKLAYRIIANCHAQANYINDEWLVRDQSAIVEQMGWDIVDFTRDLIAREGGPEACVTPFSPAIDQQGPYTGRGNETQIGSRYADLLTQMMQGAFSVIPAHYDRAVEAHYWRHASGFGHGFVDQTWLGLRSAFPSATFKVLQVIGNDDAMMSPRASLLWSLEGTHDGWGSFGTPTGAPVYIMGLAQAEFGPWGLRREYALIDETAIWKQILLHTGAV
ncbi:ester cyclase [Nereida sp. MMG025]|uniref:nuclear transport factor 2 family protein n=1 Tax=Nereida sp. MMG025 TaxID=2909981 RepID=UPI001F38C080|nr:ester cyclase [Nereida sp. MMG025]MCF6443666.1 ester cyclase [Nereida sp. MMG025]